MAGTRRLLLHRGSDDDGETDPLDWTSYLGRFLVAAPAPTAMTLLLVAAHFCACCHHTHDGQDGGGAETEAKAEHSITGMLFSSVAILARGLLFVRSSSGASAPSSRPPCIATPFLRLDTPPCDSSSSSPPASTSLPPLRVSSSSSSSSLLNAAMNDPFTMLYDTWSLLSSSNLSGGKPEKHPPPPPFAQTESQEDKEEPSPPPSRPPSEKEPLPPSVWTAIAVFHVIACAGVVLMLLPSIFQPSMLPCNSMSGVRATAWPVLNSCLLLAALSLVACRVVFSVLRLPQLALCMAMHATARLMLSFANAAIACPLPPIAMESTFASGVGVCIGVLLLTITQMHDACSKQARFDRADFYMNHAWASCVLMMGMRHIVFRIALGLQGAVHRVFYSHLLQNHDHRD